MIKRLEGKNDMGDQSKQELLHTPEGLWDHYGADYAQYRTVTQMIGETMHRYGYEDIKTPTFEFFDVFSREIGTTPSRELYKFFDKDGNTLVLRPDFTPSVARCAAKYFMDEERPLKFCYEGSAFTNTSSLQGKLKESTQMGAEYINDDSAEADAEMLALLIEALLGVGLNQFQITVGNMEYFKGVCDAAGLDEETEGELREYVSGKNYFAAETLLKKQNMDAGLADRFLQITSLAGNDADLEQMLQTSPNERAAAAIRRLIEVYRILKLYGYEKYISFDLALLSRYRYYTGILFKAYTYGVGDQVATGGRYDTLLARFGKDAPAIGFMFQIDTLLEAMRTQNVGPLVSPSPEIVIYSPEDFAEKLDKVRKARQAGRHIALIPKED